MNYVEAIRLLEAGELKRVLAVYGEESYLTEYFLRVLKRDTLNEANTDLNYDILDMKTACFENVVEACETLPFLSEKRLVILTGMDLSREGISKYSGIFEQLNEYISELGEHLILVFTSSSGKFFKGKLFKTLSSLGDIIEMNRLSQRELKGFIEKRLLANGISLKADLIHYLIDRTGYLDSALEKNLYDVDSELQKLISASGETGKPDRELIDKIMVKAEAENIFALIDAVSTGNHKKSLTEFEVIAGHQDELFMVFHMLVRHIRNLIHVSLLLERGDSGDLLVKNSGLSKFETGKLRAIAGKYRPEELYAMHEMLFDAEVNIKTSAVDMRTNMVQLITKLTDSFSVNR